MNRGWPRRIAARAVWWALGTVFFYYVGQWLGYRWGWLHAAGIWAMTFVVGETYSGARQRWRRYRATRNVG